MGAMPALALTLAAGQSATAQYMSASLDLVMGVVFFVAAPAVKFVRVFKFFGALLLLAGVFYLFFPSEVWAAYISFWLNDNLLLFRILGGGVGILFCGFIIYAAFPREGEVSGEST